MIFLLPQQKFVSAFASFLLYHLFFTGASHPIANLFFFFAFFHLFPAKGDSVSCKFEGYLL